MSQANIVVCDTPTEAIVERTSQAMRSCSAAHTNAVIRV